jgi:hypothetical protein
MPRLSSQGFFGMSAEVLPVLHGAVNDMAPKRRVSALETAAGPESAREKSKKPKDYLVGLAGFEPATPASRTVLPIGKY